MGSARPAGTAGGTTGDVATGGDELPEAGAPWNSELTSNFRRLDLAAARTLVFEDAAGACEVAPTGTALLMLAEVDVSAFKLPIFCVFAPSESGWTCAGELGRAEFASPNEPKLMGDDVSTARIN